MTQKRFLRRVPVLKMWFSSILAQQSMTLSTSCEISPFVSSEFRRRSERALRSGKTRSKSKRRRTR